MQELLSAGMVCIKFHHRPYLHRSLISAYRWRRLRNIERWWKRRFSSPGSPLPVLFLAVGSSPAFRSPGPHPTGRTLAWKAQQGLSPPRRSHSSLLAVAKWDLPRSMMALFLARRRVPRPRIAWPALTPQSLWIPWWTPMARLGVAFCPGS